jgi:hypothetical protein
MLSRPKRLPDPGAITIEPIGTDPDYRTGLAELVALEGRLAATQQRRKRAQARLRGTKSSRPVLERARDLLAGGTVGAADPLDDVKAADEEEFQILVPAIVAATQRLDEIHAELSYQVCQKLRGEYSTTLAVALEAMSTLANALDTAAAIRARVRAAGYTPSEIVLPSGLPPAARHLGSPDAAGASQAWYWRKMLTEHGLL